MSDSDTELWTPTIHSISCQILLHQVLPLNDLHSFFIDLFCLCIGLPDGSLQITRHWQYQCLWHKILSYICTYIVRYYYHCYTRQRAKIPDSPVKYRTPGNPICAACFKPCHKWI